MARRRKPKTIIGLIFSMFFLPISVLLEWAMSWRPYNSRRARISRSKKKWWK